MAPEPRFEQRGYLRSVNVIERRHPSTRAGETQPLGANERGLMFVTYRSNRGSHHDPPNGNCLDSDRGDASLLLNPDLPRPGVHPSAYFYNGHSGPDPLCLPAVDCPIQAFVHDGALRAHGFRGSDLTGKGRPVTDGEEQIGIGVPTCAVLLPRQSLQNSL